MIYYSKKPNVLMYFNTRNLPIGPIQAENLPQNLQFKSQ